MGKSRAILAVMLLAVLLADGFAQSDASRFSSYVCRNKPANEVARLARQQLPQSAQAELVIDQERNRILVSAADNIQQSVHRLLAEVDRPQSATPSSQLEARTYSIPASEQARFVQQVRSSFAGEQIRADFDPTSGRVILNATPRVHGGVNQILGGPTGAARVTQQAAMSDNLGRFLFIPGDRVVQLQQQLAGIFGQQLSVRQVQGRELVLVQLRSDPPLALELEFDSFRRGVMIGGPARQFNQMAALIQALVEDVSPPGQRTRVLRVHRTNHETVHGIIRSSRVTQPFPHSVGTNPRNIARGQWQPGGAGQIPVSGGRPTARPAGQSGPSRSGSSDAGLTAV